MRNTDRTPEQWAHDYACLQAENDRIRAEWDTFKMELNRMRSQLNAVRSWWESLTIWTRPRGLRRPFPVEWIA